MKDNPYEFATASEVLDEIKKVDGLRQYLPVSDLIAEAASTVDESLGQGMAEIQKLKILRAGHHGHKLAQDARRRLENSKLRTPYPFDRGKALLAERLKLVEEINELTTKLFKPLARLELVDAELLAVRETLTDVLAAREVHRQTGLYSGTAAFVSRLFSRHHIDWRALDALREEDEALIAEIVRRRVKAAPEGGC